MIIKHDSVTKMDFAGLSIRDYTAGLKSSASFAVITVPPGCFHLESWSKRSDKYYYVASGTVEFVLNGETHILSSGDFCLISVGEHFSYRNSTKTEAILHLFHNPSFDLNSEMFIKKPQE